MQEFLAIILLLALLFVIIVIAIIRWILRINVRVRLLEQINSKLQIIIDQTRPPKEENSRESQPDSLETSDNNQNLTDSPSIPPLVKKPVAKTGVPVKRPAALRVDCPHCKAEFDVPQDFIGHNAKCAKCRKQSQDQLPQASI